MASNNEYKRYFIILQEDDKGYEMSPGKIPTGYVKIEVKNGKVKLNAFIQNVKLEDRIEYRLILVAAGKKLGVDIGKIIIDNSGRGELSYELESDNVLKSGLNIGDFTVAAVSCGASVPLSGYTGRDKLEWKGKYDVVNRQRTEEAPRKDKKITIEEIVPEAPEPIIPPKPIVPVEPIVPPEPIMPPQPVVPPEPVMPPEPVELPKPIVPPPPVIVPKPPVVEIPIPKPEKPPIVEIPAPKPEKPPVVEIPAPKPEKPPVVEIVPEPEPEIIVQPPVIEKPHIHETKVEIEIVIPKCPPKAPMEEPCEIEETIEVEKEKIECEDIHQYYYNDEDEDEECHKHYHEVHEKYTLSSYYSGGMYRKLKKVLRRLRRYEPFEKEKGYDWFRVGDDIYEINSVAFPYMGYMVPLGYPFMSEGCSMMLDRKDYILGVKYEDRDDDDDDDERFIRYLLFGVPAMYSKKNEQYYRTKGFMKFKPHKSKEHGYFIMCLDIRSGMLCHMD
ncbi:MAG TPA: hypothetical protein VEG39_00790 [Clostridia bacterium]|nr:hypothetical protein [Clostridia bacterium]